MASHEKIPFFDTREKTVQTMAQALAAMRRQIQNRWDKTDKFSGVHERESSYYRRLGQLVLNLAAQAQAFGEEMIAMAGGQPGASRTAEQTASNDQSEDDSPDRDYARYYQRLISPKDPPTDPEQPIEITIVDDYTLENPRTGQRLAFRPSSKPLFVFNSFMAGRDEPKTTKDLLLDGFEPERSSTARTSLFVRMRSALIADLARLVNEQPTDETADTPIPGIIQTGQRSRTRYQLNPNLVFIDQRQQTDQ